METKVISSNAVISTERLSALIGEIYDCALDPALWPQTMESICRELNLRTGVISMISLPDGQPLLAAATGFEQPWLDKVFYYTEELIDLWGGEQIIGALPLETPAVLSQVNPSAISGDSQHPFHTQFNKPQGFVDAIAVGLTRDKTSIGSIGFNRHEDFGLIGPREIEVMKLLAPHLQRSATISSVLEKQIAENATIQTVLNRLTIPVLIISSDLKVTFENEAASRLRLTEALFDIRDRRLQLASIPAQRALEHALNLNLNSPAKNSLSGDPFGIPLAMDNGSLRSFHILPLNQQHSQNNEEPDFALLFAPSLASSSNAGQAIAALFGLTEAERRVCEAIVEGLTVREVAAKLDIGTSTVRTHLLRIFEKTGTHRQAELVALSNQYSWALD